MMLTLLKFRTLTARTVELNFRRDDDGQRVDGVQRFGTDKDFTDGLTFYIEALEDGQPLDPATLPTAPIFLL